jgi:mono/diheme cytochrome c family protein
MRTVFGIALALVMSPASGETLVERGAYLVGSVMVCHNCHTPEGPSAVHDFTAAGGKGGRTFKGPWGESISPNITADSATGLGSWSDDEIKRAITQGIARDGHKLKPPMAMLPMPA